MLHLALLVTAPLAQAPAAADLPAGHVHPVQHLVRIEGGVRAAAAARRLDLDVVRQDLVAGRVDVLATPEELERIEAAGLDATVEIADLAAYYARRLATGAPSRGGPYGQWLTPPFGSGGMGGYYTFDEVVGVLDQLRAAYPNLVSAKASLGTTIEGRTQWMVRVSDSPDVDEDEPEVRFDALHHAREPQGMQCTLWFVLWALEEYGSDPLATYLLDEREIYVVPCVNPDGYEYNRQQAPGGGGLWRKNRRNNGGGSIGVDLNRNYPFNWGWDDNGSSSNPASQTYRGTGPASEPEVQNMVAFIAAHDFETALSVHTYSNLWLAPWGYDELNPANVAEYDEVGAAATEVNGYPYGAAAILLYEANGVTIDYDHGQHGTMSWTPEIGSSSDGFWPPQSRIVPLAEENLLAFQRTALAGGAWIRPASVDVVDGGDGDGFHEPGEEVHLTAHLRNTGRRSSGAVALALTSPSPDAAIVDGDENVPAIASFSGGANASPLRLRVQPGTPAGTTIPYTLSITVDGWTQDVDRELVVGERVVVAAYDFEAAGDRGWSVGSPNDASTGTWERGDPNGTAAQPEDDHTPDPADTCWFTGQASSGAGLGTNDVDDGSTTLVSPVWDLAGGVQPTLRYWRWYSNDEGASPNADVFQVDLSNDGGATWTTAETVGPTGAGTSGGWVEVELDVASVVAPTSQVRARFVASDLGSGSIVEAALDDVEVSLVDPGCPAPVTYCVGAANAWGPGASIGWSGSTDVLDDDLTLDVTGANPSGFGLFYFGQGRDQAPAGNGFRCIAGAFQRLPVVTSDPTGSASYAVPLSNLPGGAVIQNGETWDFQYWYRDLGGAGFNYSDALEIEFCAD